MLLYHILKLIIVTFRYIKCIDTKVNVLYYVIVNTMYYVIFGYEVDN